MKVLLDTHTFLWIAAAPEKLPARATAGLPSSHKDPFDRMLAAPCIEEGLPCLTRDPLFSASGIESIW